MRTFPKKISWTFPWKINKLTFKKSITSVCGVKCTSIFTEMTYVRWKFICSHERSWITFISFEQKKLSQIDIKYFYVTCALVGNTVLSGWAKGQKKRIATCCMLFLLQPPISLSQSVFLMYFSFLIQEFQFKITFETTYHSLKVFLEKENKQAL